MPMVKKEVHESITKKLKHIQQDLRSKIFSNKMLLKEIAAKQALAKRELTVITLMLGDLRVKP